MCLGGWFFIITFVFKSICLNELFCVFSNYNGYCLCICIKLYTYKFSSFLSFFMSVFVLACLSVPVLNVARCEGGVLK